MSDSLVSILIVNWNTRELVLDCLPQPFHFRFPTFAMTLANGGAVAGRLLLGSNRRRWAP